MEHEGQHEQDDDVYGGDLPEEVYMESDFDPSADAEAYATDDSKGKKRLQEIEEEAGALRGLQAKHHDEIGLNAQSFLVVFISLAPFVDNHLEVSGIFVWDCLDLGGSSATQAEKEEVDSRSIYVGNVDYACTPEEVQQHFQSCGTVNRVTILTDKFGQPKGFAYVEFVEVDAIQNALLLNESELHGRQLKVSAKRTNVPGMRQYRGRHPNPYFGSRRPFMPAPGYPPYGYGRVPRFRRPMRYRPY
ncbi:polyadenylate-binding protein [Striga asiatica]|uniref:Polyadenylate-binding protein n=1 Tax=Striga asiatica TaxID=4170 RepID=A0A5A7QNQ3_STRAF|nr:polyadenylate-binding protein [Striga asiatica]